MQYFAELIDSLHCTGGRLIEIFNWQKYLSEIEKIRFGSINCLCG